MPAETSDQVSAVHANSAHGIEVPRLSTTSGAETRELIPPSLSLPTSTGSKGRLEPMRPTGRHDPPTMLARLDGAVASIRTVFKPTSTIAPPPLETFMRVRLARIAATSAPGVSRSRSGMGIPSCCRVLTLAPSSRAGWETTAPRGPAQLLRPSPSASPGRGGCCLQILALSGPGTGFRSTQGRLSASRAGTSQYRRLSLGFPNPDAERLITWHCLQHGPGVTNCIRMNVVRKVPQIRSQHSQLSL